MYTCIVLSGDGASTLVSASVRCMDTRHMCTGTVWGIYISSRLSCPLHHHSLLFTSPPSLPPLTSHPHFLFYPHSLLSPHTITSYSPPSLLPLHPHSHLSTLTHTSPPSLTPLHPHSHLSTLTHTSPPSFTPLHPHSHLSTITHTSPPSLTPPHHHFFLSTLTHTSPPSLTPPHHHFFLSTSPPSLPPLPPVSLCCPGQQEKSWLHVEKTLHSECGTVSTHAHTNTFITSSSVPLPLFGKLDGECTCSFSCCPLCCRHIM